MIEKGLIFYLVRKVISDFSEDWQEKLKGIKILVYEDEMRFDPAGRKRETLGSWNPNFRLVEFFLTTIRNYIARENDIYVALRRLESMVEHELLHAVGLNHEGIKEYRKGKIFTMEYRAEDGKVKIRTKGKIGS